MPTLMPFTKRLLIAVFVSFLLHAVAQVWVGWPLLSFTGLSAGELSYRTIVQLVAYPLGWVIAPRSALYLVMNIVFLWWSVGAWEARVGSRETMRLVAATTLASGLMATLAGLIFHPAGVIGPGVLIFSTISAFGWSLRKQRMSLFGAFELEGVALVWIGIALAVLNFITDPNVPLLVAELTAIAVGVGFVEWRRRGGRFRKSRIGRSSKVVSINAARKKDPIQWLNRVGLTR